MLGTSSIAVALGAVAPGSITDDTTARPFLKSVTAAGGHVILIEPGGKRVVDMRTDRERDAALAEWNDANPNDQREKAPSGLFTSTDNVTALLKYVRRYLKPTDAKRVKGTPAGYGRVPVNFGLHLGPSRLIVVDADYPAEVDAFRTWYAINDADGDVGQVPSPTVLTPGTLNADGGFDHRDGGHWYFTVPDVVDLDGPNVPAGRTIVVDPVDVERVTGTRYSGTGVEKTAFTVKTGNSYVVIPPSVRDAGPYVFNMPDDPAPLALIDAVTNVDAIASSGPKYSDPETDDTADDAEQYVADGVGSDPEGVPDTAAPTRATTVPGNVTPTGDEYASDEPAYVPGGYSDDDGTLDDRLADWSEQVSWDDILTPYGWTLAARADDCGCPVWTRPHDVGEAPTPKSMTTHEPGCQRGRVDHRHPAAHVWSDHVDGPIGDLILQREREGRSAPRTLSKFAVYAALRHGGDMSAAVAEAGVSGSAPSLAGIAAPDLKATRDAEAADAADPVVEPTVSAVGTARREGDTPYPADDFVAPRPPIDRRAGLVGADGRDLLASWGIHPHDDDPDADVGLRASWPSFGSLNDYRDIPRPGWLLDNVFQLNGLTAVIGDSGSGKSAVVIDLLCTVAAGVGSWHGTPCASFPVVYVAGEGMAGAVDRARAWEKVNGKDVGDRFFFVNEPLSLTDRAQWGALAYYARSVGAGAIVIDTLARATDGLDENSAADMSTAVGIFDDLKVTTGATVMVVHHTTRGTDHARGSTALKGALDSEVLVRRSLDADQTLDDGSDPAGDLIEVSVVKQKNGPDDFVLDLALTDRAAAMHMHDDGPYSNDQRPKIVRGQSTSTSMTATGELVVTSPEGRPAAYVATFGTASAGVMKRPLPPIEDTADRIVTEVEKFDTLYPTRGDIEKAVVRPVSVDVSAKGWSAHILRALDHAVSKGRLSKKGARFAPYDAWLDDDDVDTVRH